MDIYSEVGFLKGVGPKSREKLNRCGIFNILDVLLYFPRDYEYIGGNSRFENIDGKEKIILKCKSINKKRDIRTRTGKTITSVEFLYGEHKVVAKWFNQPYMKNNFCIGKSYNLIGKFKRVGKILEVISPLSTCEDAIKKEIIPKYPLKGDISNKLIEKLIYEILNNIEIKETLPQELLDKYSLRSLSYAIKNIHFPKDREHLQNAINRLKFQELFTYSLKLLLLKNNLKKTSFGISFPWVEELKGLKEKLPFKLTNAQTKVVRQILRDQKSERSMNRLVQGDVGSGKTVVALIAIFNAIKNGYKCAFMAPTEILASQHYEEAKKLFDGFGIDIEILTGGTSSKQKNIIKEKLKKDGEMLIIGTHALFQEGVIINKLGLVVTDEQHRFGVEQRSRLMNKNKRADCLVMTATPIPRTLALCLYSDLDVSVIDELPPGRKPIDTLFYKEKMRHIAYELAEKEILKGRQVYIVCPLIEEDEKEKLNSVESIYESVSNGIFKEFKVEILHGKMKNAQKEDIISRFKENETQILISTTVIEVGVNVPNASVMIIENAERFGLAQLHQLRGRVGRGEYESHCILIANAKNNTTIKRMKIMTESNDGFYIAEQDLKLRGSGEVFGKRQSGDSGFILADIYEDIDILRCAKKEAFEIIQEKSDNNIRLINEIHKNLQKNSKYICFN